MASTIAASPANRARSGPVSIANRKVAFARVTMDNSYPTGGLAADFATLAGFTPSIVVLQPRYDTTANKGSHGILFQYDYTNKKIMAFWQKDPAAAGGADIRLVEVTNATDLSGVVLDVIVWSE